MQYFYNAKKKSTAAHIWTGSDTACTMLSAGGIHPGKKVVHADAGSRKICAMCQINFKKLMRENDSPPIA